MKSKEEPCVECRQLVDELWLTDNGVWLCPTCWAKLLMNSEDGEVLVNP